MLAAGERRTVRRNPMSSSIYVAHYIETVVKPVPQPVFPEPFDSRKYRGEARRARRATNEITDNARPQPGKRLVITAVVRIRRSYTLVVMNDAASRAGQGLFRVQIESVTSGDRHVGSVRPFAPGKSAGFPGCEELVERGL